MRISSVSVIASMIFGTPAWSIWDGVPASTESTAAIVFRLGGHQYISCTGVLVGRRTILTAAHCVPKQRRETISFEGKLIEKWIQVTRDNYVVYFGSGFRAPSSGDRLHISEFNQSPMLRESPLFEVEKIIFHPNSDGKDDVDLALVILSLEPPIISAELPLPNMGLKYLMHLDSIMFGVGFGISGYDKAIKRDIYGLKMKYFGNLMWPFRLFPDETFNFGSGVDQRGTRAVDSGSPLYLSDHGSDIVIGILRAPPWRGDLTGEQQLIMENSGGKYTSVTRNLTWIRKNLK